MSLMSVALSLKGVDASYSAMIKMQLSQSANVQLTPFNFVLNGNFTLKIVRLLKARTVLTPLPSRS